MFFEEDRIAAFREMICSDTVEEREAALDKILPYQQGDFEKLYEALEGNQLPFVSWIRLFMSSFRQRKLTSRSLQKLRASLLRQSRTSSLLCMSSTR